MNDLEKAAQAVLDRWDSPAWEWMPQGPTAALMADLRRALAAHKEQAEPVVDKEQAEPVQAEPVQAEPVDKALKKPAPQVQCTITPATLACKKPVALRPDVLAFLQGLGPLDGCYFGWRPEGERGEFWWRKHLPAPALAQQQAEPVAWTMNDPTPPFPLHSSAKQTQPVADGGNPSY